MQAARTTATRPAGRRAAQWWTRQRVLNGLRRAARDLCGGDGYLLPRAHEEFSAITAPYDHGKWGPHRRYPSAVAVLRHFPSMTHAYREANLIAPEDVWQRGERWWNRERMIEAGAHFYREFGVAPTNDAWWQELARGTARTESGHSNRGSERPWPSCTTIQRVWRGMRNYWADVKAAHPELRISLDHTDLPWSPLEEWFITESVGVLPRTEVARLLAESGMGRSEAAIKRRLYDLGVNSYNRWGWTVHKIEAVTGVSAATIVGYIRRGELPYFRGAKCIYVDPGDLTVIREYNWAKRRHPRELSRAVRASLALRVCYAVLGYDRGRFGYHKARPEEEYLAGRQARALKPAPTPKPRHLKEGHWVRIAGEWKFRTPGAKERVGRVTKIFWSPERVRATQKSPPRPACWVATVELPRVSKQGRPQSYRRTRYNVPVSELERARKPYERKAARPAASRRRPAAAPARGGARVAPALRAAA